MCIANMLVKWKFRNSVKLEHCENRVTPFNLDKSTVKKIEIAYQDNISNEAEATSAEQKVKCHHQKNSKNVVMKKFTFDVIGILRILYLKRDSV